MSPSLLAALGIGGVTALNEMTTGQDKKLRDAILKSTAYRAAAYDKSINPGQYDIYTPDPLGKGIQAGGGAYQMASGIENDKALNNFLNAKGSQAGGIGSSLADYESAPETQYWRGDEPYSAVDGPSFMSKEPGRSAWSLMEPRNNNKWKLGLEGN